MANAMTITNNFTGFKEDFKTDTGLEFTKENMLLYIQYYNARVNDLNYQYNKESKYKLSQLPNEIRNEISDLLRTHEVIKELLKPKP